MIDIVHAAEIATDISQEASNVPPFVGTLGLNAKLFIAQLINFAVIVFVLKKWAYGPLVRMMDERSATIAEGIANAKRAEESVRRTEEDRAAIVLEAKKEGKQVMDAARAAGDERKQAMVTEAKEEVEKIVRDAKTAIARERETMVAEVRAHVADLVVTAAERILTEKLDEKKDKKLIEEIVRATSARKPS